MTTGTGPDAGSAPTSSDGRGRANERSLSDGDVLLETRTAYLFCTERDLSFARPHPSPLTECSARAARAAAGHRPLTVVTEGNSVTTPQR